MLTFLDSNVLIAAATGKGKHAPQAVSLVDDPARTFASAAALMAGADEFITAERPDSPFKNVRGIIIISIYTP